MIGKGIWENEREIARDEGLMIVKGYCCIRSVIISPNSDQNVAGARGFCPGTIGNLLRQANSEAISMEFGRNSNWK